MAGWVGQVYRPNYKSASLVGIVFGFIQMKKSGDQMKKFNNLIPSMKSNWKAILFTAIYVICFFIMIGLSFKITEYVKGVDYAIFSPLLLCITLLSSLSFIAKSVLNLIFKEEANQVAKKSSTVLIPAGIFIAITALFSLLSYIPLSTFIHSELEAFLLLFAIPAYFIVSIMIGFLFLFVSFIAFALLRLVIKYTKAVIVIFFVSGALWFVSLGNISSPLINIGNGNNSQATFQDILSMNLTDSSFQIRNTFFIYNDNIYAYVFQKSAYNNYGDEFFVVDLQGKNKKVISNSDEMRLAQFLHIDYNEAYYYTMFSNAINKINLNTGDISVVYKFEDSYFSTEYDEAKQKLYEIKPEFLNSVNTNYIIEDDYYLDSYYPRTITVKNINTNKIITYDNTIYWNIEDSILYLLRGEKKNTEIFDYSSIEEIRVEKIILE